MKSNYLFNKKIFLYGDTQETGSAYRLLEGKLGIAGIISQNDSFDSNTIQGNIIAVCDDDLEDAFEIKKELRFKGLEAILLDELLELLDFSDVGFDDNEITDIDCLAYGAGINFRRNYRVLKDHLQISCVYDGDSNKDNSLTCENILIKYKDTMPAAGKCLVFTDKIDIYKKVRDDLRSRNIKKISLGDIYVRGLLNENN